MMAVRGDGLHHQASEFDVCVIGGGMAGVCAAIASARGGARTALIHDRPVFGGNASSEIRMWICGAHGKHNKETGILEEIQLENAHRNPSLNYSIWDSVLYGKVFFQPNLTPLMNCSCTDAKTDGDRIVSVTAWQLTSQTWHTVRARLFIDCSGDSILAPLTGALYRVGRESRQEFDEDIQPAVADDRTMGNSLLIQLRRTSERQPFVPPRWAYKFERPEDLPHRINGVKAHNFWWIELGGVQDTIRDAEAIRDELMRVTYGVWDYIKNRAPQRDEAANWAVEWIGSLPGKRESRRYVGDHVLTQNDIRDHGRFHDTVAYGGWSMDDHHPAGLLYPGQPTIFHPAPTPYGIAYRSLYSRNIGNLLFAGRNISVTHAALSSTRVMATCAMLGQAVGTAAALCIRDDVEPRALSTGQRLAELQARLMDDDCFLPGFTKPISELSRAASLDAPGEGVERLLDGWDRDREDEDHAWAGPAGSAITFTWPGAVTIPGVRIVFDSNLSADKRMPCSYPQKGDRCLMPRTLVRRFRIEAREDAGAWRTVHREDENIQRLVRVPLGVRARSLRLIPEATWGDGEAENPRVRIFSVEPVESVRETPRAPDGPAWSQVVAQAPAADLAPPDSGLESEAARVAGSA